MTDTPIVTQLPFWHLATRVPKSSANPHDLHSLWSFCNHLPKWITEALRLARLPVAQRLRLALDMQTLQFNLVRARLARQYPRLGRRALNLKLVEELVHG